MEKSKPKTVCVHVSVSLSGVSSYFVLGVDHGAIIAPPVRLQVSCPELLHQHAS